MEHLLKTLIQIEIRVISKIVDKRTMLYVHLIDYHTVVTFKFLQKMVNKLLSYNSLVRGY